MPVHSINATIATRSVLEVGQINQTRAGRQLTVADFTDLGLQTPVGLFNLSSTANLGSGGALVNKGTVTFASGIEGIAATAAQFTGSTAQALYVADTGAADPFRIRTGSWGGWFRTAKRGAQQSVISKWGGGTNQGWLLYTNSTSNTMQVGVSTTGANVSTPSGTIDVCDNKWHFGVATFDGSVVRGYVDGVQDLQANFNGLIFASTAALNAGSQGGDAATASATVSFGRVDEAFVTHDVLTEDQVRLLYSVSVPHTLTQIPKNVSLNVRRRRRGSLLVSGDFPSAPLRGYNLADLTDFGSNAVALTANPGTGSITQSAGPNGTALTARFYTGAHTGDSATDAGLPSGVTSRSYGIWIKTTTTNICAIGWGTLSTADARIVVENITGNLLLTSSADTVTGQPVADGQWHHVVGVEENAPIDGIKRKLYLDGRLVGNSLVLNPITLGGANSFRVGANPNGTGPFVGQLARGFVHSAALTPEQIQAIYYKGSQDLGRSPKVDGYGVERIDATNIHFIGDDLQPQDQIEIEIAS